jgi:hypothetical protein
MKNTFLLLLILVFLGCSSNDDSTNPLPENNVLNVSFKLDIETSPFLPQGMVYDATRAYFYVAAKGGGLLVFDNSNANQPNQIATVPISDFGNLHAMHIYQRDNLVYLALGDLFSPSGSKAGIAIIDVSDPKNPQVRDYWDTDAVIGGSAIVIVEGNYAYLGAMNFGLMIFDISNPDAIDDVSEYLPDINFPVENPNAIEHPNARGMAIRDNLLYLCYDAGGIRVIDVSDKEHPNQIGRYNNDTSQENTPKAYNNIILDGNFAYLAVDYCGFEIIDISNTSNIVRTGWWNPWNCDSLSNLWYNSAGHSNQMGFDSTNNLVFLATGRSELSVIDVSDRTNPTLKGLFGTPDNMIATWGMTLKGNDVYLLYIAAGVPIFSDWNGIKKVEWSLDAVNP